jgi:hypothetical protein
MEIRLLAPTGALGAGFSRDGLRAAVERQPHVIACDAGSTDSGPAALGSGTPKLSDAAVRRDLADLLAARAELGVPLIIGSCGTAGRDDGVDRISAMVAELAAGAKGATGQRPGQRQRLRVARIYSGQDPAAVAAEFRAGRLRPLPAAPPLTEADILDSHIVAMMGTDPIEAALAEGADVVLAGRASDTALYAALPNLRGADPGLTWHAAKTVECGAACAIPPGADGLFVYLRDDHFEVETLTDQRRLTPRSVAAHTLYENGDPFLILEPNGALDTRHATYEAVTDHRVRVSGSLFGPAEQYTVKLEGAAPAGYQTVIFGGIRDKVVIEQLPALLPQAAKYFTARIADLFPGIDPATVDISYRSYGVDAVLGVNELPGAAPREVGVLITVTAPTQALARDVATFVAHASSHLPIPQYDGLVSTLAYPFSPPETDRGPVYRFTLNHVLAPSTPTALFRTELEVFP